MTLASLHRRSFARWTTAFLSLAGVMLYAAACNHPATQAGTAPTPATGSGPTSAMAPLPTPDMSAMDAIAAPSPDPRVGLAPGDWDAATKTITKPAAEAIWNMTMVSHTAPSPSSAGATHSDLAFDGKYVIQGNYNGYEIWDISNPSHPTLATGYSCPASQDDISVYGHLLFVSAEATNSRVDCGTGGAPGAVNKDRIRGVRIFDITDIAHPKVITEVQTCRGSHTHTVVTDPNDKNNIYIYISGTSGVRPAAELARCIPDPRDPNTALFNIEVIKVPLAHPEQAAVVSHARIFQDAATGGDLVNRIGTHGAPASDQGAAAGGRGRGGFGAAGGAPTVFVRPAPGNMTGSIAELAAAPAGASSADEAARQHSADSLTSAGYFPLNRGGFAGRGGGGGRGGRGGRGNLPETHDDSLTIWSEYALSRVTPLTPTSAKADSMRWVKSTDSLRAMGYANIPFPPQPRGTLTQCHDITVYPSVGLAGGACAGMGLLLDIRDPANPRRIDAVADTNFSFWHSATFSNDGSKVLFSDEWGGGGRAYCRATDPMNWGGDAMFNIVNGKMVFQGYYKMPAAQTQAENCVAHNGSLIPVPGREVMVQSWYQGGISVFDWTDPRHPKEIAFFDRGPLDVPPNNGTSDAGFWSSYWYNGYIVGSEIQRGMDIFELKPSPYLSQNELDAAKLVKFDWLNVQDQPKFVWPANIAVPRAYLDQLVRWNGISSSRAAAIKSELDAANGMSGGAKKAALTKLASELNSDAATAKDGARVRAMAASVTKLATAS
jgi:hypothetical protein